MDKSYFIDEYGFDYICDLLQQTFLTQKDAENLSSNNETISQLTKTITQVQTELNDKASQESVRQLASLIEGGTSTVNNYQLLTVSSQKELDEYLFKYKGFIYVKVNNKFTQIDETAKYKESNNYYLNNDYISVLDNENLVRSLFTAMGYLLYDNIIVMSEANEDDVNQNLFQLFMGESNYSFYLKESKDKSLIVKIISSYQNNKIPLLSLSEKDFIIPQNYNIYSYLLNESGDASDPANQDPKKIYVVYFTQNRNTAKTKELISTLWSKKSSSITTSTALNNYLKQIEQPELWSVIGIFDGYHNTSYYASFKNT